MDDAVSDRFLDLLQQISSEHQRTVAQLQSEIDDLKTRFQRPCDDGSALELTPADPGLTQSIEDEASHSVADNSACDRGGNTQEQDNPGIRQIASVAAAEDDRCEMRSKPSVVFRTKRMVSSAMHSFTAHFDDGDEGQTHISNSRQRVRWLIQTDKFELLVVGVILLNTLAMAMEMQYKGMQAGYNIGYRGSSQNADEVWPFAATAFPMLEKTFTFIFVVELALRIYGMGFSYACHILNWVDITVVLVGVLDLMLVAISSESSVNNPLVRLLRLVRMLKGLRILTKFLGVLKLLIMSIVASVSVLCYSLCLLGLIQIVTSMFMTQLLSDYINDTSQPEQERTEIYRYWGTFTFAFLTMFEVTLANWSPPCRALVTYVHEGYAIFFYVYRCTVGFAILSVISAVFIQKTLKQAQSSEEQMIQKQQQEAEEQRRKLDNLFKHLDTSGDGTLGWDEFACALEHPRTISWLKAMEIDVTDLQSLFKMLDGGDGSIEIDEFTTAMARVKGPAKSLDLLQVLSLSKEIRHLVADLTTKTGKTRQLMIQAPVRPKNTGNSDSGECRAKEVVQETNERIRPAETPTPVHLSEKEQEAESGACPAEEARNELAKASV